MSHFLTAFPAALANVEACWEVWEDEYKQVGPRGLFAWARCAVPTTSLLV